MSLPFMDIFKEWAHDYDGAVSGENPEYKDVFVNYDFMLQQASQEAFGHTIEFGPGTGNLTHKLMQRGLKVTPVEPSEDMLKIGEAKTGLSFVTGDFLNFDVQDYDTVISSFAFHHLTDEEKQTALEMYYNALPTGGKVVILDTMFNSVEEKEAMIDYYTSLGFTNLVDDLNREYYPYKSTMQSISKKVGFKYQSTQMNRFAHLQVLTKVPFKRPMDLIGNTPMVELTTFPLNTGNRLFVKLESYNLGGSIKDRLGMHMVERALSRGDIKTGTIVDATAGNTGIGLALAALKHQLTLRVYVPEKFSQEKQDIMRALGAEVINTPTEGGMIQAREAAMAFSQSTGAYFTNQFESLDNPASYQALIQEIESEVGRVDMIVAGAGSGGTFSALSEYFTDAHRVVVEPEGSILNGGTSSSHRTEGIGVERWPVYLNRENIDAIETISDIDAFTKVSELALQEGLLVGSSSGAALMAALNQQKQVTHQNIVVIFPDAAERYLSKGIFNIEGE